MVAVVSGNGLGLTNTSLSQLGLALGGPSGLGQTKTSQLVNVATGNLLLQDQDETLSVRGFNTSFLRTYNSRGLLGDAGQDGFITGYERSVVLNGTLNDAASTITMKTGDGQSVTFTYSGTGNTYTSTAGGGAHDTLVWNTGNSTWTFTEGSTRRQEIYDATGRLSQIRDFKSDGTTPAVFDVVYNGTGQVMEVRGADGSGASGDALLFDWVGGQLLAVRTREGGIDRYQVSYGYDAYGRLAWVQQDLQPTLFGAGPDAWDPTAANNDGQRFRTTYTYVTASASDLRLASLTQSDGTVTSYTYEADGAGGYRVKTVTLGDANTNDADGAGETVTFTYTVGQTDVTDSLGRVWTYKYDANKQLTEVDGPAISGLRDVTTYQYDASSNLTQVKAKRGAAVLSQYDYAYDANGNQTWQWDALGNAISRTYTADNQLAAETHYIGVDPDRTGAALPTGGITTRYLYDAQDRLQYVFDGGGALTEYTYFAGGNGVGQRATERRYLGATYSGAGDDASLRAFALAADKSNSTLVEYTYDGKGRLSQSVGYVAVEATTGAGFLNYGAEIVRYAYDAHGLLLQQVTLRGTGRDPLVATNTAGSEVVDYAYDGLGRLLSVIKHNVSDAASNDALGVSTTYAYTDSANKIVVTLDSGATSTQAYNAARRLVTSTDSGAVNGSVVSRVTQNYYNSAGELRATQDPTGARTYYFYDAKGSLVGVVDGTGAVTEYVLDGMGRRVDTISYSTRIDTSAWLVGTTVSKNTIDEVRPGWSTSFDSLPIAGLDTTAVNNASYANVITLDSGRLVFNVNTVATNTRPTVTRTTTHSLGENVGYHAEVSTGATQNDTYLLLGLQNTGTFTDGYGSATARRASVYFRQGQLYLNCDVGGVQSQTLIGATQSNSTYAVDIRTRNGSIEFSVYIKGQDPSTGWTVSVDATAADWGQTKLGAWGFGGPIQSGDPLYLDNLSESALDNRHDSRTYDSAGRLSTETNATGLVTTYSYDASSRLLSASSKQTGASASTARTTRMFYDNEGRLLATLDAAGYLSENSYDNAGRLIRKIGYATRISDPTTFAAGDLATLRSAAGTTSSDTQCRYFYDGRDRLILQFELSGVDANGKGVGYVTEFGHDEKNNLRSTVEYANLVTDTTGDDSLAVLHAATSPVGAHVTQRTYNGLGQLVSVANDEGAVTTYSYDEAGRLVRTSTAANGPTSQVRDDYKRYDVFGNVIGEISGELVDDAGGTALLTITDQNQLNTIYSTWGTTHCYDLMGRRTESTDRDGNKVWYFYDADGRNTFTVRGIKDPATGIKNSLGEVVETRYDAFGQVTDTLAYTGRIAIGGTQSRADVQPKIATLAYVAATDTRRSFAYDVRGLLTRTTDALGNTSAFSYTSFGELFQEKRYVGTSAAVTTQHSYDARGLELSRTDAVGTTSTRSVSSGYDAFGRLISTTGALGLLTSIAYDRLGRQLQVSHPGENSTTLWTSMSYDAFDRVVSQNDAAGRQTTFAFDDAAQSLTVTSPSGVVITTVHDDFGQNVTVTNADSVISYQYDLDGNLTHKIDQNNHDTAYLYDKSDNLVQTTDADGRITTFVYDAAGRMLSRAEDPGVGKLNLISTYTYDAQGRQITVTDASLRVTQMSYDTEGRLVQVVQDPGSGKLNLTIAYTYDAAGRQLTVTQGTGAQARTVRYAYDALGRRTSESVDPNGLNLTTTYAYDKNDNLVSKTDPAGNITHYAYDQDNRLRFVVDATKGVTETAYDLGGRATMSRVYAKPIAPAAWTIASVQAAIVPDASDATVYRIYNGDDKEVLRIDGTGGVQTTAYDPQGRVCMEVTYANPVSPAALTGLSAALKAGTTSVAGVLYYVTSDPAADQVTYYRRSADGTGLIRIDALGQMTRSWTDATGHLIAEYTYATPLVDFANNTALKNALAAGTAGWPATGEDITKDLQNCYVYDAAGRVRYKINAAGAVIGYVYDAAGRVAETDNYVNAITISPTLWNQIWGEDPAAITTIAGLLNPAAEKQIYSFDGAGRVTQVKDALNYITQYRYDSAGNLVTTIDARNNVSRSVFDAAGRKVADVDPLGNVTRYWYDTNGRTSAIFRFGAAINTSGLSEGTTVADIDSLLPWSAPNQNTFIVRDAEGRVRFTIDSAGAEVESTYDGAGRLVSTRAYANTLNTGPIQSQLFAGTALSVITKTSSTTGDRYTYNVYDAAGRVVMTVASATSATALVTERQYNGAGQVTADIVYGTAIANTIGVVLNKAAIDTAIGTPGHQAAMLRQTRYVYAVDGSLRFTIDDAGGVTEKKYNGLGQVIELREYTTSVAVGALTEPALASLMAGAAYRKTLYAYDLAGQLKSVTDGNNNTESYAYNATGHRTSLTDKLGNTWLYEYDNAGRMTKQRSPTTTVYRFDSSGTLLAEQKSIVTFMDYDGCGNMTTKTENYEAVDVNDRRTTTFTYDARGLLLRTTFPASWTIDTTGHLVAGTTTTSYVENTYDAFGNAVVQRDVTGNYSYKVYDQVGNLAYDIDANGNVSKFAYNAFRDQTALTRYGTPWGGASGATPVSASQITDVATGVTVNAATDRTLVFAYDQRGNKTSVTQPSVPYYKSGGAYVATAASPKTNYTYDNYGNLIQESVLLEGTTIKADTFHYYDDLGNRTMSVDPMGYLTAWTYNAVGQVTSQTEYARAATGTWSATSAPAVPLPGDEDTGYDRTTTYTYDALGRKTAETAVARHVWSANGSQIVRDVVTNTEYDAADHVTALVADGVRTETAFDALGRAISVTEASRQALIATAYSSLASNSANSLATAALYTTVWPYTEMGYDAYGNAVRTVRYANGKSGAAAAVPDAVNDQVSIARYDHLGRLVLERDGNGAERYREYDLAGNATKVWYRLNTGSGKTWRVVATYAYDKLGRQITTRVTRQAEVNGALQGTATTDSSEQVRYNAFGEITAKDTSLDLSLADSALQEQFVYDLAGRLTRTNSDTGVFRDYGYDLAGHQTVEKRTVYTSGTTSKTIAINNTIDENGNVLRQALPGAGATGYVTKTYDRWGNVLDVTDAMGYQTSYEYNELNQVVRELTPMVKVVSESGIESWVRPERRWFYDGLGRQVGTKDANGVIRQQAFDAGGQLVSSTDGEGYTTLMAFNALGKEVARQDAVGHITYNRYDKMNRLVETGDFLRSATGATRTQDWITLYTYDVDGNRIQEMDRLNHAKKYDFDSRGLLVRSESAVGDAYTYAYDLRGNKVKETTPLWVSTSATQADRDGDAVRLNELTWEYDYFGKLNDHNDLGRSDYNYSYDAASGMLMSNDVTGGLGAGSTVYNYFDNGLVSKMTQGTSVYTYKYDANGNRTYEESVTQDGNGTSVHTIVRTYYDSHNRVTRVTQDSIGSATVRDMDIRYDYDAVGNRRRVLAQSAYSLDDLTQAVPFGGNGPQAIGTPPPVGIPTGASGVVFKFVADELFSDIDNSQLTYAAVLDSDGSALTWLSMTTDAVTGQLVFSVTGSVPAGTYKIRLTATENGTGLQASTTFLVAAGADMAPNLRPSNQVDWVLSTGSAWSHTFNVADYFVDYDLGDELSFSMASVSPSAPWLTATTLPNGFLQLSGSPLSTQKGTYQVTVKATDRAGFSATRVINLVVQTPAAPVATSLTARDVFVGRSFADEILLSSLFTDSNGDALNVTATMSDGTPLLPWLTCFVDRSSGTPYIHLDGAVPTTAAVGSTYTVKFTATDPSGLSTTKNIVLTARAMQQEAAPVLPTTITYLTWTGGTSNSYAFPSGYFSDSNSDSLSVSLSCGHLEQREVIDPDGVLPPRKYSVFVTDPTPPYLSFNAATCSLVGTVPQITSSTTLQLYLTAVDSSGKSSRSQVNLTLSPGGTAAPAPTNQPPVLVKPLSNLGVVKSQYWSYSLPQDLFSDPEGSAVSFTVTQLPAGLTYNAATGMIAGTCSAIGTSTVKITATDASGASTVVNFTITVAASGTTSTTGDGSGTIISVNGNTGGAVVAATAGLTKQEQWFTYDRENRARTNWKAGSYASMPYTIYDGAGRAIWLNGAYQVYTERGQLSLVMNSTNMHTSTMVQGTQLAWSTPRERRFYDEVGRLKEVQTFYGISDWVDSAGGSNGGAATDVGGWMKEATTYTYTNDNQILTQTEYGRIKNWNSSITNPAAVVMAQSTDRSVLTQLSVTTTNHDGTGSLTSMKYEQSNVSAETSTTVPTSFTQNYTYTYVKSEDYLEDVVTGTSTNTSFKAGNTYNTYDAYGHRKQVKETSKATQVEDTLRYFSFNGSGQILTRWNGTIHNGAFYQGADSLSQRLQRAHFVYANDQLVGSVDEAGEMDVIARLTGYESGENGVNVIKVQTGDTFESLAQRAYGNSQYWYVIASANGMTSDNDLANCVGMNLKVPDIKVGKNDAQTFKPYNPAEIIGDTTPSLAYVAPPAAAGGCSAIATVVRLCVAIALCFVPGGQFATASLLAGGGELFAQAVEISEDLRSGFDFGGIVTTALAAGLANGPSEVSGTATEGAAKPTKFGQRFLSAAKQAVESRVATFAINRALGQQDHWSWKQTAAGAVTAGLSAGLFGPSQIMPGIELVPNRLANAVGFKWQAAIESVARGIAQRTIGYAVDKAIVGEAHWNWGDVAGTALTEGAVAYTRSWQIEQASSAKAPGVKSGAELLASGSSEPVSSHQSANEEGTSIWFQGLGADVDRSWFAGSIDSSSLSFGGGGPAWDIVGREQSTGGSDELAPSNSAQVAISYLDTLKRQTFSQSDEAFLQNFRQSLINDGKYVPADVSMGELNYRYYYDEFPVSELPNVVVHGSGYTDDVGRNLGNGIGEFIYRPNVVQAYRGLGREIPKYQPRRAATGYPGGVTSAEYHAEGNNLLARTAVRVGAYAIPDLEAAYARGRMPTLMEVATGTFKTVGNAGISAVNFVAEHSLVGMVARSFDVDPTTSPLEYSDGEVTVAAVLEGISLVAGPVLESVSWANSPRSVGAIEGLDSVGVQLATRARVMSNLAATRAGNLASNFDGFVAIENSRFAAATPVGSFASFGGVIAETEGEASLLRNASATFTGQSVFDSAVRFGSNIVIQRSDIEFSIQNVRRMKAGNSPYVRNAEGTWETINLHHIGRENGKVIEILKSHNAYNAYTGGPLHIPGPGGPVRNLDVRKYWRQRLDAAVGGGDLDADLLTRAGY